MDRFEYAEPRLTSGEDSIIREKGVKLYDGDDKVSFPNEWHIVCFCAMPCVVVDIWSILKQVLSIYRWISIRLRRLVPDDGNLYSHRWEIQNVAGWSCTYKVGSGYHGYQRFGGTLASIYCTLWCHNRENQGLMNVWYQYVIFLLFGRFIWGSYHITFLKCFFRVWF